MYKILSLVNLAPDIVEGIMSDPPAFDFSVKKIFSHRLPVDWNEQRIFLGLPEKDYAVGRMIPGTKPSRLRGLNVFWGGGDDPDRLTYIVFSFTCEYRMRFG